MTTTPSGGSAAPSPDADAALRAQLDRVAAYEASIRPGPVTALMRRLGRTRGFAVVYRRVGPVIDPQIQKIRDGAVLAKIYGFRVLILHTTGAKSGQPRVSPMLYIRDGDDFALVGTNLGQPKHPGWTANLLAHPDASVVVGPETVRVRAEQVDEETWQRLFPDFVEMYPGYANYIERRQGLTPRMFLLHPQPPAASA